MNKVSIDSDKSLVHIRDLDATIYYENYGYIESLVASPENHHFTEMGIGCKLTIDQINSILNLWISDESVRSKLIIRFISTIMIYNPEVMTYLQNSEKSIYKELKDIRFPVTFVVNGSYLDINIDFNIEVFESGSCNIKDMCELLKKFPGMSHISHDLEIQFKVPTKAVVPKCQGYDIHCTMLKSRSGNNLSVTTAYYDTDDIPAPVVISKSLADKIPSVYDIIGESVSKEYLHHEPLTLQDGASKTDKIPEPTDFFKESCNMRKKLLIARMLEKDND